MTIVSRRVLATIYLMALCILFCAAIISKKLLHDAQHKIWLSYVCPASICLIVLPNAYLFQFFICCSSSLFCYQHHWELLVEKKKRLQFAYEATVKQLDVSIFGKHMMTLLFESVIVPLCWDPLLMCHPVKSANLQIHMSFAFIPRVKTWSHQLLLVIKRNGLKPQNLEVFRLWGLAQPL